MSIQLLTLETKVFLFVSLVRSFNVDKKEHPVQWLLDTWTNESMLEPVMVWLEGITRTEVSWDSCLPVSWP